MATKLGDLKIAVIVAGKDAKKQLRDIGVEVDDVEEKTQKYSHAADKQGLSMQKLVGIAGGLTAVYYTVLKPLTAIINTTSAVNESLSKASVVFGDNMDSVNQWSDNLSAKINRSRYDLIKMASTVQDTFVPLGFARDEATKLSKRLTELAVDVASFNDAQDVDVMRDFQSALVGNHETVRKYGIVLTEAQLKQEALNSGIIESERELTSTEKVQARLNLIMKGSKDAIGDAARTADQYANTSKGAQAATKDLQVAVGVRLLPVLAQLKGSYADTIQTITDYIKISPVDEIRQQRIEFISLMRTLQNSNTTAEERNRIIGILQSKYSDYLGNIDLEKAGYNKLETAINDANTAFKEQMRLKAFQQIQEKERKKVADLTQQVTGLSLALERDKQIRKELQDQGEVPLFQEGLLADPEKVKQTIENLNKEIDRHIQSMNDAQENYDKAFKNASNLGKGVDDAANSTKNYNEALEELAQKYQGVIDAKMRMGYIVDPIKLVEQKDVNRVDALTAAVNSLDNQQKTTLAVTEQLQSAWTQATLQGQNGFKAMESAFLSLIATMVKNAGIFLLLNLFTGGVFGETMSFGKFMFNALGSGFSLPGAAEGTAVTQPTQMIVGEGRSAEIVAPQHKMEPMLQQWMTNVERKSGIGNGKTATQMLDTLRSMERQLSRMQKDITVIQDPEGTYRALEDKQKELL